MRVIALLFVLAFHSLSFGAVIAHDGFNRLIWTYDDTQQTGYFKECAQRRCYPLTDSMTAEELPLFFTYYLQQAHELAYGDAQNSDFVGQYRTLLNFMSQATAGAAVLGIIPYGISRYKQPFWRLRLGFYALAAATFISGLHRAHSQLIQYDHDIGLELALTLDQLEASNLKPKEPIKMSLEAYQFFASTIKQAVRNFRAPQKPF